MSIKDDLKKQVRETIQNYTLSVRSPLHETDIKAALLSGMSLISSYLAKHDGSKEITAQIILSAIAEVGEELNLQPDKIARRLK